MYFARFLNKNLTLDNKNTFLLYSLNQIFVIFASTNKLELMTAVQMNAEMLRNMSIIAEDEYLLKRAAKYLRKLVAEKQADSTEFTREEFFARINEARKQPGKRFDSVEELDRYIRSL